MHGYRWMQYKCLQNGLVVPRDDVAALMQLLDPDGIALRVRKRLKRRKYFSQGTDFVWHIDGYDKLKRYGIAVHGCIDGFSRCIIWLKSGCTNNDPAVVAGFYLTALEERNGCPTVVRADCGTENTCVCDFQLFLRMDGTDDYSGTNSFKYGKSTSNQRIEALWCMLRKQCTQSWMNLFQELKDGDSFCGDEIDQALIRFCFLELVQVIYLFLIFPTPLWGLLGTTRPNHLLF